jgi:Fe-S-cluster containining protein
MNLTVADTSYFSQVCIEKCGGKCCAPWWGIITYSIRKEGGLFRPQELKSEVVNSIIERAERITEKYVTTEETPRPLFTTPERYNLAVQNIKVANKTILINLRAMFAFRCLFLSEDKKCMIHPSVTDGGNEIRPEHCGYMGSPDAKPNEKGYCRIIHAAATSSDDPAAVDKAIETELMASEKHYKDSFDKPEEAAERVVELVRLYCLNYAPHMLPPAATITPGRNEACHCGSGKKYKKCHGM